MATFERILVTKNFQKSPNLLTLEVRVFERERESELDGNIDKVDSSRFCFAAVQGVYLAYE